MKTDIIEKYLESHQKIAWDADLTLINGPYSKLFTNYIIDHPEKEHHIITFRNKEWADDVWNELFLYNLEKTDFKSLTACPMILHEAHDIVSHYNEKYWAYHAKQLGLSSKEQLKSYSDAFLLWKATVCQKLGCTILVDDNIEWNIKGCHMFDIKLFDAIKLEML